MLINGARDRGDYDFQVNNSINFQGWGLINLPNSLPPGITNQSTATCSAFIQDQSPTNALATGDSQTYHVHRHQHRRSICRCASRWRGRIRPAIPPPPSSSSTTSISWSPTDDHRQTSITATTLRGRHLTTRRKPRIRRRIWIPSTTSKMFILPPPARTFPSPLWATAST